MRAMSKDSNAPSPSSSSYDQPSTSWKSARPAFINTFSVASGSATQLPTKSTSQPPDQAQSDKNELIEKNEALQRSKKRRKLTAEEEAIRNSTAAAISISLASDQLLALYPDVDTPFEDKVDAIKRLLPYHIFQHPKHDLDIARGLKGKAKATELDVLKEEIAETKFAIECRSRLNALQKRFKKARLKPGKNTVPHDQAIILGRSILESDREAKNLLDQELTTLRSELDKVMRAKRIQNTQNNRPAAASTSTFSTYSGYTPNNTQRTAANMSYSQYYGYSYPYGQSGPYMYHNPQYAAASHAASMASYNSSAAQQSPQAQSVTTATPTPVATQVSTKPSSTSLPIQLPLTSLPALQALGILPVPKAALSSSSQSQPAAVLLGSTNSGTTLLLEINVAVLQPTQMSGLAILLSSLMRNSTGTFDTSTSGSQVANSGQQSTSTAAAAWASPTSQQQQSRPSSASANENKNTT